MKAKYQTLVDRISLRIRLIWQVAWTGNLEKQGRRKVPQIQAEDIAELKTFFPMDKFFIMGHARSGTTLLTRLVRLHPEVHCNYQAHFFTRPPLLSGILADQIAADWFSRPANRWNRGQDLSPVALRAMMDYILERDARREGKSIVGDKSPNVRLNGQAVSEMHIFYPDARLIYIVRDGRDTLISHRFQQFIDGTQHLTASDLAIRESFAKDSSPYLNGERSLFTEKALRRMAEGWVQNVVETDRLGRKLYGDRYHALRYEELLKTPYETISDVWRFLGTEPSGLESIVNQEMNRNPDATYQKKTAGELVKNFEKGKRGSWQELFTERDRRIFKELAGETLIAWGYEKDLEW